MDNAKAGKGYLIGVLSRETGVNIETIRYYERIGIMPKPDRTPGGYRQFSQDQLKRLTFVRKCRELGFSLREVRTLLELVDSHKFSCGEIHEMTVQHLRAIDEKMARLGKLKTVLTSMSNECSRGDVPACPIVDALFEVV
ncbi:MAG: helix-turn-helix domain-containing protein [Alphaproteobacteria bacterium]|nr:helix-turn-helix domain-containing protein [Alphaproteobacteria bacterium]